MATRWGTRGWGETSRSWVVVSLIGLVLFGAQVYDLWDDVFMLGWNPFTTLAETGVLFLLALGLVYGGFWLRQRGWSNQYTKMAVVWMVGITGGITALYAISIAFQLSVMGALKPGTLVLNGVVLGAVTAFGVGVYNAQQKQVRDELERSRKRYQTLTDDVLDTSNVATFILDDDFRVVWLNRAAATYFGIDRDAAIGADKRRLVEHRLADRFENSERFRDELLNAYEENAHERRFECHALAADDREERWLEHWSQPIETGLYEGGRIEHYTDVTALKRREQELDTRERSLREMYDVVSNQRLTFEEQVERLVGIGRSAVGADCGVFARIDGDADEFRLETVQSDAEDLQQSETVPLTETYCERTVREDRTIQFDTLPPDVEPKTYGTDAGFEMYVGTPVYEDGTRYGSLCFLNRDSTDPFGDWGVTLVELMSNWMGYELHRRRLLRERKRELHRQEVKFEDFVATVDNYAIFTLDTEGRVTSWNRGSERIKGYTQDEILGEHFEVFYPEDAVEAGRPDDLLTEARETGFVTHEGWRIRRDGSQFWANVTIVPRYDDDGTHVGYTKVVEDQTERREYEQTIERERERLEFMNRLVRHHMLNGLNVIDGRATVIDSRLDPDHSAREHLETIRMRVADMTELVETIRDFMNVVASTDDHETESTAIRPVLDEKVELARKSYSSAVFEVGDVPDESVHVVADELLGEVFENVLSNAVIHNDKPVPNVEVWTSETTREVPVDAETGDVRLDESVDSPRPDVDVADRSAIVVHVADNGPGIPDEQKEALLRESGSHDPGSEFGLFLVTEMMNAYGGSVDVRDGDDGGAVVDLTFLRAPDGEQCNSDTANF